MLHLLYQCGRKSTSNELWSTIAKFAASHTTKKITEEKESSYVAWQREKCRVLVYQKGSLFVILLVSMSCKSNLILMLA